MHLTAIAPFGTSIVLKESEHRGDLFKIVSRSLTVPCYDGGEGHSCHCACFTEGIFVFFFCFFLRGPNWLQRIVNRHH